MQTTSVQKTSKLIKDIDNQIGGNNMFKNLLKKRLGNEKGLTLIELLAVIVILAIVSAIAIPAIGNIVENSRVKAIKSDAINLLNAANIYYTDNGTDAAIDEDTAGFKAYVQSYGSFDGVDFDITNTAPYEISATISGNGVSAVFTEATIDEINSGSAEDDVSTGSGETAKAVDVTK